MDHIAHIRQLFTTDPVAGTIVVAVVGGVFALVTSLIGSVTTIITAYIQVRGHREHEAISQQTNDEVMGRTK